MNRMSRVLSVLSAIAITLPAAAAPAAGPGVYEVTPDSFKAYPFKRPAGKYAMISSQRYADLLAKVTIDPKLIVLPETSKQFLENYRKHLLDTALYIANFIGNKEYAPRLDDALYYAFTVQHPDGGKQKIDLRWINNIAVTRQAYPNTLKFSFWPWVKDPKTGELVGKLNGLYFNDAASSGRTLQISLYDTFQQNAVRDAMKAQNKEFTYDGDYVNILGKWGNDLVERMPILSTFMHESTHCIFQDMYGRGYGGNGNGTFKQAAFLFEGITEFLTQRAVFYLAGGYEDFNDLGSYPGQTLVAGLLFSIEPRGLLDWYVRETTAYDRDLAQAVADRLSEIKDVHTGQACLPPHLKGTFVDRFMNAFCRGNLSKKEEVREAFAGTCDLQILLDWLMVRSPYWAQIPLKHRIFILDNFFGLSPKFAAPVEKYKNQVKSVMSKAQRRNWDQQQNTELLGMLDGKPEDKKTKVTPMRIEVEDNEMLKIICEAGGEKGKDFNKDIKGKKNKIIGYGYLAGGPEDLPVTDRQKVQEPYKGPAYDTRSSLPDVKEWFQQYWKSNGDKSGNPGYRSQRDGAINDFSIFKAESITRYLMTRGDLKTELKEWHDFLDKYLAPNLLLGRDGLGLPALKGLLKY